MCTERRRQISRLGEGFRMTLMTTRAYENQRISEITDWFAVQRGPFCTAGFEQNRPLECTPARRLWKCIFGIEVVSRHSRKGFVRFYALTEKERKGRRRLPRREKSPAESSVD